jgi:hypothetical protein
MVLAERTGRPVAGSLHGNPMTLEVQLHDAHLSWQVGVALTEVHERKREK